MRFLTNASMRGFLLAALAFACGLSARAQTPAAPEEPTETTPTIRTETRLVLVDAVVSDKKGNYIHDLTAKDFKVYEDGKEQKVKSFSFESDPASPAKDRKHYMVLFFDNTTIALGDQIQARQAAVKFIDTNAGPENLMAIVNFGGVLQIAQNFTNDAEKLKRVASGVKSPSVQANDTIDISSSGVPGLSGAEMDYAARTGLLALRSLAKTLASIPGRKTLILLTSGFFLTPEQMPEVTAVINECNKANVAVYPVDVRGLVASSLGSLERCDWPCATTGGPGDQTNVAGKLNGLMHLASYSVNPAPAQHGGGGGSGGHGGGGGVGGGGGGHGGGGSGGGRGSGGNNGSSGARVNNPNSFNNPYNQSRLLVPSPLSSATTNQQVMYMLASGTGGFVILNTNDLLGGMQKIAKEQNEYYLLGYTPQDTEEGKCHALKVKVDRGGADVRARTGYCNVTPKDQLSGDPIEKELETHAAATTPGALTASLQLPFFFISPHRARVDVAMEIPIGEAKPTKVKGKLHVDLNVLGIATAADGKTAARFSDTVKFDFETKKDFEEFLNVPVHYENQFEIAPGKYTFKVVFEAGRKFGKLESPLAVDEWDGGKFSLSSLVISSDVRRAQDVLSGLDAELLAGRTPLIAQGAQITPSGTTHLKKDGIGAFYAEIYEPLATAATPPNVGIGMKITDRKTGQQKFDSGLFAPPTTNTSQTKSPIMPVGLKIPIDSLPPGSYHAELRAMDSAGHAAVRAMDFDLE